MKRRKNIILKGEERVHYYLDVFNYIKKMKEIDLLNYSFFDHDQYKLLNYLNIYLNHQLNLMVKILMFIMNF